MGKIFLLAAAISGFMAVAIGAFGAHALKAKLSADMLGVYETGVDYHFWHTLALLAVGLLSLHWPGSRWLEASGWAFLLGIILFSGSLYFMAITNIRTIGPMSVGLITPLGGVSFLAGWLMLFVSCLKNS